MRFYKHLLTLLTLCAITFGFAQCRDDDDDSKKIDPFAKEEATHTLLIYMVGDNSLSSFCQPNIDAATEGLLDATEPLNLIVYKDNNDSNDKNPILYRIRHTTTGTDTLVLRRYDEQNSADAEVMQSVIHEVFSLYDTEIKGIVLWSHAMSWIPSGSYVASAATSTSQQAPAYFGQDGSNFMELWTLREALEQCPHIDYLLVDACHFATAEVAYELNGVCDYIVASPTEIMGDGFPYKEMIPILAAATKDNMVGTLTDVAAAYASLYADNGAIALIRTASMDAVAQSFKATLQAHADTLIAAPATWAGKIQQFGRNRIGTYYYFFDMAETASLIAPESNDVQRALAEAVLYEFHSPIFTDGLEALTLRTSCGLAVSLKPMFALSRNSVKLNSAYPLTKWGAMMADVW